MCESCLSDSIFMGADGCQGNGGFGESHADAAPGPGKRWEQMLAARSCAAGGRT